MVQELARINDLPVFLSNQTVQCVDETERPDIALSILHPRKIKDPLLSWPKNGIINYHPAPLPELKGTAGYNVAILRNMQKWAVAAHYVDEQIDTGGIIQQFTFDIDPEEETAWSLEKVSMRFLEMLIRKIFKDLEKSAFLNTSVNSGGEYISRKQMEGLKKIDFEKDNLDRKIRAFWFPPYTGAYIEREGKKYTLINESILKTIAESLKNE
jgi:methionyl-tRNA formyltransferase